MNLNPRYYLNIDAIKNSVYLQFIAHHFPEKIQVPANWQPRTPLDWRIIQIIAKGEEKMKKDEKNNN